MTTLTFDKGVNKDALPADLADGFASDSLDVRFRAGRAFKRGGIASAYNTPSVTPYFLSTYILPAGTRFMVRAGIAKVHVDDGTTATEITKYANGFYITTVTRISATQMQIIVTGDASAWVIGNTINISNVSPSAYNGPYTIYSVDSSNTFKLQSMASDPGTNGTVSALSYAAKATTTNFTGAIDDKWTGGSFNGILVLNNPVDGMFYWDGSTSSRLRPMPGLPSGFKCDAVMFYKNFIIALAPTLGGIKYPHLLYWGASAEAGAIPTSWTASGTNDAGDSPQPAESPGSLVDGVVYGDLAFAFDQDSIFAIQYIGGNDVLRVFRVPGDGLLARHCAVSIPEVGMVYLSNGDVFLHNGAMPRSLAEGRIRDWIGANIDSTNRSRAFIAKNTPFHEVWVCFPMSGSSTCDKAIVWNWDSDTWAIYSLPNLTCATTGILATSLGFGADQRVLVGKASNLGVVDSGTTDFGSAFTATIERIGLDFGNREFVKSIDRSRWNIDGAAAASFSIFHGSHTTADGTVTYATAGTLRLGTDDYVDARGTTGRFNAVKMTTTAPFGLRTVDVDVIARGKR